MYLYMVEMCVWCGSFASLLAPTRLAELRPVTLTAY